MNNKFYLDTSIWLDYYEKRSINSIKLILKIINECATIIYSDYSIKELRKLGYLDSEIMTIFNITDDIILKRVHLVRNELEMAKRLSRQMNVSFGDAIHAILANNHEAILVSRDKDFKRLRYLIRVKSPEELIT